jgi:hypothetical protein
MIQCNKQVLGELHKSVEASCQKHAVSCSAEGAPGHPQTISTRMARAVVGTSHAGLHPCLEPAQQKLVTGACSCSQLHIQAAACTDTKNGCKCRCLENGSSTNQCNAMLPTQTLQCARMHPIQTLRSRCNPSFPGWGVTTTHGKHATRCRQEVLWTANMQTRRENHPAIL